jgi:asparaginyl-tRNA synthetase
MRLNDDNRTVAAMDLLVTGGGEIIGGSQREERPEIWKNGWRNAAFQRRLRVVYGSSQIRRYPPLRVWLGIRASGHVFDGRFQYPGRDIVSRTVGNAEF